MPANPFRNPFYAAVLFVGVLFSLTATMYVVAMVRLSDPANRSSNEESGVVAWIDRHGVIVLFVEIALLTCLTTGAIGLDEYFSPESRSKSQADRSRARSEPSGQLETKDENHEG